MGILVHKYGGTSVASTDKIKNIAKKIVAEKEKGHDLVVVVSAMGKTTDDLIELSKKISTNPDKRDLDMLLSTGEQVSISLLSMALKEYGVDAICLTGFQAGIKTQGPHTKNKIIDIDIEKVKSYLKEGKVVVVAGFQGMNEKGDITTLSRGGSDTTAVALAAKLRGGCHIYTDVDGIYSVDPRLYKEAKKLDDISYEEMMEMASLGAGIMEPRAVEIGCKYQIPIYVASSQHDITGTTIRGVDHNMEENVITGLSISDDVLMVTISNLEFKVENIAIVFEKLAEANINVDMISQTGPINGIVNLSFTASTDDYDVIKEVMQQLKKQYQEIDIELEDDITKVSVIGVGMLNQSGVTEKIFRILANHHISFRQVTTSEISISYTINKRIRQQQLLF